MNQYIPTHRTSTNFATADRPRCMNRDENYLRQRRQYRNKDYASDEYEQTNWYWNMSHQPNGDELVNSKKSNQKSKNAVYGSQRSQSSGFQSFFRWFKKDEKSRVSDISYPREVTRSSSNDTLDNFDNFERRIPRRVRRKLKAYDSSETITPPSSPRLSRGFNQSSSCDSVFSTASSFAFVPPVKYLSIRNQKQPEPLRPDRAHSETYQLRIKARDQARELDKRNELALRQKYQLYTELSDAETSNNNKEFDNLASHNRGYKELSLPAGRKSNLPDSAKLHDLSVTRHRRSSSDTTKDKEAEQLKNLHVKGKRKAPPPPKIKINPRTLSPKSSLGRKKRPAPQPPRSKESRFIEAASSTSLLEDKDIKALIEGTSTRDFSNSSTSSIPVDMERKAYVSPYLKIREDRKLTDEQKRILIDQVSKNTRKNDERVLSNDSPQATKRSMPDVFTIEKGQLVYQGNESPKLPRKEEKLVAPSSPISPRPWFKRQKENKETIQKTIDKRKNRNDDKDLPELGYSRNSFFGNRFNIFSRIGDDSKKKDRDAEKRKSQIGIPNISELDREAAEIIQRGHETNKSVKNLNANELVILRSQINSLKDAANEDEDRPRSTKDLINKFEADSSNVNRITLNTSFIGRREFFGESFSSQKPTNNGNDRKLEESKISNSPKSKLPLLIKETNGIRRNNDLMGLWTCPYCTLQNPNWKIICEACEKIKPYEKRFCPNNDLIKTKEDPSLKENPWEKKTEVVLKYFPTPISTNNGLSKSASETTVAKSLKRKSPSPSRIAGSPQMNMRRNLFKTSSEQQEKSINVIAEETTENFDPKVVAGQDSVVVKTTPTLYSSIKSNKQEVNLNKKATPDFNEVRSARLAKFNLLPNFKKINYDEINSNEICTNRKQSPEKRFPDKLDFSNPAALELEKERLREKIRAMNSKALAEKYPVLNKLPEKEIKVELSQPPAPISTPLNIADPSKLGAIRKTFKNPLETRRGSDEKILNHSVSVEKADKISISIQTKNEAKKFLSKIDEKSFVPITVKEVVKDEKTVINDKLKTDELTIKEREEVEEISDQLKSKNGIEEFKATLRSSVNKSNTLAINKILRHLETAIAHGKYDEAARFAADLAKMKVSLSVTRQKERPRSEIEPNLNQININLTVKDGVKDISSVMFDVSLLMTINDFKQRIEKDFRIPRNVQKLLVNEKVIDKELFLKDCNINDSVIDVIVFKETPPKLAATKSLFTYFNTSQDSDDETQNERVGNADGAFGVNPNINPKLKIEEDGWECPLCTLINTPNRPGCLACSTSRPTSYKLPTHFEEIEYKLKVNEDLQTFFEMEKIKVRPQAQTKNDLNRKSANRKSSEIFNILVEEKTPQEGTKNKAVPVEASSPSQVISSPNITKNKYRGVDNFNPNTSYVFPKPLDIRKPVITSVIYKSTAANTKEIIKPTQNHYEQLVSLDLSNIAPNVEKFECSICFMEIEPKAGAVLRECLHSFCKPCLASHIKYSDEAEVKCPFIDDQFSCQSFLQEREIRSLVSKEEYDKHLTRSIRQAENKIENTFHCKTPNCRGWCIFEDTTNSFRCPVCTIVNCLTCGAIHDGINCKQYQDTINNDADSESAKQTKEMLQDLIDKEEALNCPTCHIFLLKKWGCDWLKCSFCKTEICWVTKGPRWGPNGKGDTSAGCKCGIGGKKCSPKCNYCH